MEFQVANAREGWSLRIQGNVNDVPQRVDNPQVARHIANYVKGLSQRMFVCNSRHYRCIVCHASIFHQPAESGSRDVLSPRCIRLEE